MYFFFLGIIKFCKQISQPLLKFSIQVDCDVVSLVLNAISCIFIIHSVLSFFVVTIIDIGFFTKIRVLKLLNWDIL